MNIYKSKAEAVIRKIKSKNPKPPNKGTIDSTLKSMKYLEKILKQSAEELRLIPS